MINDRRSYNAESYGVVPAHDIMALGVPFLISIYITRESNYVHQNEIRVYLFDWYKIWIPSRGEIVSEMDRFGGGGGEK